MKEFFVAIFTGLIVLGAVVLFMRRKPAERPFVGPPAPGPQPPAPPPRCSFITPPFVGLSFPTLGCAKESDTVLGGPFVIAEQQIDPAGPYLTSAGDPVPPGCYVGPGGTICPGPEPTDCFVGPGGQICRPRKLGGPTGLPGEPQPGDQPSGFEAVTP